MKRILMLWLVLMWAFNIQAQSDTVQGLKKSMTLQYAGSTGWLSTGFSLVGKHNRSELGLLYGYTPVSAGGPLHSATLKFTYNPYGKHQRPGMYFEPLQAGVFLTQTFGRNLGILWGQQYDKGYYWWPRALRTHIFLSTQVSWFFEHRHMDRISLYAEANTNDLYICSYFPNRHSLHLYDIVFLGIGLKLCFK